MPSIEAHATQDDCCCCCHWYAGSYVECVGQHSWYRIGAAPSCEFPSQPTSAVLGRAQAQSLKSAKPARSPDTESVERREQMAFGLCAGEFLFPTAWVLGASVNVMAPCAKSVTPSLGKPAGRLLRPPARKGQLEGAHFPG